MTQSAQTRRIEIRLFATLRENRGKVLHKEFPGAVTPADLLVLLDIPLQEIAILLVNGRDAPPDRELADGDTVSLFPPVGGG